MSPPRMQFSVLDDLHVTHIKMSLTVNKLCEYVVIGQTDMREVQCSADRVT